MESGNRTAGEIADDIIDNLLCFGMSLPDRIPNRKRIVTALNVYASQQCEALQSENERLKEEANKAIFEMLVEKGRNVQSEKENTRLLERVKELEEALKESKDTIL
jgi:hypothetical protein